MEFMGKHQEDHYSHQVPGMRREKGQKIYVKKQLLNTSLIRGRKQHPDLFIYIIQINRQKLKARTDCMKKQEKNNFLYTREFTEDNQHIFQQKNCRRMWHVIFKALKKLNCQPRILYMVKLSFRIEGDIKSFPEK